MIFSKKKKIEKEIFCREILYNDALYPVDTKEQSLHFLIAFFNDIRPSQINNRPNAETNMQEVILFLENHPRIILKLQKAILLQLVNTNLESAFTKSGIPIGFGFWNELGNKIKHKILPAEQDPNDFLYVLNRVFYKKDDYVWVNHIKRNNWINFFDLLQFPLQATDKRLREHLIDALTVLSFQVVNDGLEKEVADFIPVYEQKHENPFIIQSSLVLELKQQIELFPDDFKEKANKLKIALLEIENEIDYIKKKQGERGTSIRQSYTLLILSSRIERMLILLDTIDDSDGFDIGRFVDLFKLLIRNENRKNSLREFISQSTNHIAYQIAEHKGIKGGKYITSTRREYFAMLLSAMGGGFIVCFVAVFKNLLTKLHYAHFWQGFWYSINYSVGFIAIDQSGSTLATKQPAFTANTVAESLDTKKNTGKPDLHNLAITITKVFRSQFASFLGNLIIVFPLTYCMAWGYHRILGHKIVSGTAALQLLTDQHPFQSLSLLYACNTGVFLFASGIIAGYVQNKIRYSRITERILAHPAFHFSASGNRKNKWVHFIEKHAGTYAGSISLGFFLGMAGPLGKIFGIPFDIRHITISAGNVAIGVYGLGFHIIPTRYLVTIILGVLGIGFLNFLVSFSLSFFVAVKSRGIKLGQYPELVGIIWRYFLKRPVSFIFPPKLAQ